MCLKFYVKKVYMCSRPALFPTAAFYVNTALYFIELTQKNIRYTLHNSLFQPPLTLTSVRIILDLMNGATVDIIWCIIS